ncbi:MAG TPA: helix-turn-helix domain-containing protein [Sporichthya sp.]|nr:helix-turn-helix domain-containing protein [Sporichthya sp.]
MSATPALPEDPLVRAHVVAVATALNPRLAELTQHMRELLATRIQELDGDEQLVNLLGSSIEGNLDTILHGLIHGIPVERTEPPSAAVEYARRLAQRGVPVNALVRAYRLGQQFLLATAAAESIAQGGEPHVQAPARDHIVGFTFDYIDWISQQVVGVYEEERERWLADRSTLRTARVMELVSDDGPDDVDAAEAAIGYRLRARHVAAVIWVDETGARHDQLSRFSAAFHAIAKTFAVAQPLLIARDRACAWAWLTVSEDFVVDIKSIGAAFASDDRPPPMVALGRPLRGLAGFRQSHLDALDARRIAVVAGLKRPVISYEEPGLGIAALLALTPARTRDWVHATLGDLALDDENSQRLRETLRVFLSYERSFTATADAMLMHKNSIKYRVANAEKTLGRSITEDRQAIELALNACHWLGASVLR